MSGDDFSDEDWIDLDRCAGSSRERPDITVSLMVFDIPTKRPSQARARISLRRAAATWVQANGPKFRAQIAGNNWELVRLIADPAGGYNSVVQRGVAWINMGVVPHWPNEKRAAVSAQWRLSDAALIIVLPDDFARTSAPGATSAVTPKAAAPKPFPITTHAAGLERETPVERAAEHDGDHMNFPREIGGVNLTKCEATIMEILLARGVVSKEAMLLATRDPLDTGDDDRDAGTAEVWISKLRKKLEPLGVSVETQWGEGYRLNASSKARLRMFVEKARAA